MAKKEIRTQKNVTNESKQLDDCKQLSLQGNCKLQEVSLYDVNETSNEILDRCFKALRWVSMLQRPQPMGELFDKSYFETLLNIQFIILNNQILISLNEILNSYIT